MWLTNSQLKVFTSDVSANYKRHFEDTAIYRMSSIKGEILISILACVGKEYLTQFYK